MIRQTFIILFVVFVAYSCHPSSKNGNNKISKAQKKLIPADTSLLKKQQLGIDLVATGNNPVTWRLEMDLDKNFVFRSIDGINLVATPVNAVPLADGSGETYTTKVNPKDMIITIYKTSCDNPAANQQPDKKVEVLIANKLYSGCGNYLFDYRLNDTWILDHIDSEQQEAANYAKGLPKMKLDLNKNKMTGNDGCNTISSVIEVKGARIRFSKMISTQMACLNNKAGKIFTTLLNDQAVQYYLTDSTLVLELINDSRLVFRKAD